MASRSLGTLTYSIIAEIGGFVAGMDKAERIADQKAKKIAATAAKIGAGAATVATAAATAVVAWSKEVADLGVQVERMAGIANTSTKTFQQLAFGAGTVGVSAEKLADIFKDVQDKVGDFMQTGGGALADFFENIAPKVGVTADQFKKLSGPDALQLYVSSLEKAGVSSSEMTFYLEAIASDASHLAPLLKNNGLAWQDLSKQASAFGVVIDSEVIAASKELDRQLRSLEGMFQGLKNQVATATIPTLVALTGAVVDVATETKNLSGAADALKKSDAMRVFAEDVGRELAKVGDYIAQAKREFAVLVDFAESSYRAAKAYGSFDFEEGGRIAQEFRDRYGLDRAGFKVIEDEGKKAGKTFVEAYDAQLAKGARTRFALNDPRRLGDVPSIAEQTAKAGTGTGTKPKKSGGSSALQEAAAQLAADLAAFKNTMESLTGGYANQMQILEALRAAGLKDEQEYYSEKIRLTQLTNAAQEEALAKEIERLQQEKLSGKDAININKQIADVQAKLTKAQQDGATAVKVLGIESEAAYTRTKSAILSARQAAQDFYDTTVKGYQRQLEGLGMGTKFREFQSQIQAIEDNYQRQRQDLANQRAQAELIGPLSAQARKEYDERLAIIQEFQSKTVDAFKSTYAQIDAAQKNWLVGASEALRNYADEAGNVAKHAEETVTNALKGLEDQLVNFFTGKKFDVKALFDSITGDLSRAFVKEQITGPLAKWLADSIGLGPAVSNPNAQLGTQTNPMYVRFADPFPNASSALGGGSSGGWLSSLVGGIGSMFGGLSNSIATPLANALPGDALDNLLRLTANFGGFRAAGGPVAPNTLYRVNERGPELFVADGGAQMLLTGAQGGNIVPNGGFGKELNVVNNFNVQGQIDRRTQGQITADVALKLRQARRMM